MSAASDLVTCLEEEQAALDEVKDLLPRAAVKEAKYRKDADTLFLRKLANQSKDRKANYLTFKELAVKSVRFKVPNRRAQYTLRRIVRNDEPGFGVYHEYGLEVEWIPDSAANPAGGKRFDHDCPRATWAFDFDDQRVLVTYTVSGGGGCAFP